MSASKRHLVDANGNPFLMNGDSPWMLVLNANDQQIKTYLDDRAGKNFNAILVEAPGAHFSTQTPTFSNADGQAPFTSTSFTSASFQSLNDAYWRRVDLLVDQAKSRGIAVLMCPAYLGYGGGSGNAGDQGWDSQINAASSASLQAYGTTLANRYSQGNVIWVMGGDYNPPNPGKVWNIATGIRSVNPSALITFHGARTSSAYSQVAGLAGFNLNNTYTNGTEYTYCATEYARPGPMPFFHIEGWYEGDGGLNASGYRRQAYATILSGGCGHLLGVQDVWGFGAYGTPRSAAETVAGYLNTTAASDMTRFHAFFTAYPWHLLVPRTDSSLVTTALGSGSARIMPALASDASFAMIWSPGTSFSVSMSAFSRAALRARWYDPATGTFTTVSGSPLTNTGTRSFSAPGDRVLVIEPA